MSRIFEAVIVIVVIAALVSTVANNTTGITIAHTGFTPNPNVTGSPGAVGLLQIYPLVFVAIGLAAAFAIFKETTGQGGFLFVRLSFSMENAIVRISVLCVSVVRKSVRVFSASAIRAVRVSRLPARFYWPAV